MSIFVRFFIAFLGVSGLVAILTGILGVQLGRNNFWDYHGILFLIFVTLFPRLTLLVSSVSTGGFAWWIGWLFAPRVLVALLATLTY